MSEMVLECMKRDGARCCSRAERWRVASESRQRGRVGFGDMTYNTVRSGIVTTLIWKPYLGGAIFGLLSNTAGLPQLLVELPSRRRTLLKSFFQKFFPSINQTVGEHD